MAAVKLALVVGIDYVGTSAELAGCVNDANHWADYLRLNGYTEVIVLTESQATRQAILDSVYCLVLAARLRGASEVFFSFSGHGISVGGAADETDGRDEHLVPYDYQSSGTLPDNELHEALRQARGNVRCFIDCCHSGTSLDLRYRYVSGHHWVEENANCGIAVGGRASVMMFAACMDNQLASEWYGMVGGWGASGAMTGAFILSLRELGHGATCFKLLKRVRETLADRGFGPGEQLPQISSNHTFDENQTFFMV